MIDGYASDSRNPYGRVSQEIATEAAIERRLEREARERRLGTLYAGCSSADEATDCARVEVSYFWELEDLDGPIGSTKIEEHAGYFIVHVKVDGAGTEDDPLAGHPASIATDAVYEHCDPETYPNLTVDDVYAE